jgi:hypothetical protein
MIDERTLSMGKCGIALLLTTWCPAQGRTSSWSAKGG